MSSSDPGHGFAQRLQRAWLGRGPLAVSMLPLALLFGAVGAIRRMLYRARILPTLMLPVPVIVVGNLIAGGAGKTPAVMAIVRLLRLHGFRPGIISRGYGRAGDGVLGVEPASTVAQVGDEPLLMRLRTGAPVFVGRDRIATGQALLQRHPEVDVIVSDDGLQHLRLGRVAQVLVFDERGAGNGWPLPAGPLREPLPALVPPRSLVLYNAPGPSTRLRGSVVRRALGAVVELHAWRAGAEATPGTGAGSHGQLPSLSGRPVVAAAGVAHPDRFFTMLRAAGLSITPLPLPDHFDFATLPWPPGTDDVVVTEKDAVKLEPTRLGATRVWVAALDFAPPAEFESALLALLPPATTNSGPTHGNAPS